jgi:hypothetical protein
LLIANTTISVQQGSTKPILGVISGTPTPSPTPAPAKVAVPDRLAIAFIPLIKMENAVR